MLSLQIAHNFAIACHRAAPTLTHESVTTRSTLRSRPPPHRQRRCHWRDQRCQRRTCPIGRSCPAGAPPSPLRRAMWISRKRRWITATACGQRCGQRGRRREIARRRGSFPASCAWIGTPQPGVLHPVEGEKWTSRPHAAQPDSRVKPPRFRVIPISPSPTTASVSFSTNNERNVGFNARAHHGRGAHRSNRRRRRAAATTAAVQTGGRADRTGRGGRCGLSRSGSGCGGRGGRPAARPARRSRAPSQSRPR